MTRVALVTGAASGVGAATARALASTGASVAVCDVDPGGQAVAEECEGVFVPLDVADPAAWDEAVATIEHRLGPIDLAHLNAGVMTAPASAPFEAAAELHRVTADRLQRVIGVNLTGVALGIRALSPGMIDRQHGSIVATASYAGLRPFAGDPIYTATKHGVVGLVRAAAPGLAAHHVRLQAICPAGIDTPLLPQYGRSRGYDLLSPGQVASAVTGLLLQETEGVIFWIDAARPVAAAVRDLQG